MTKDTSFYLDTAGTGEVILRGNDKLEKLEYEYMQGVLAQIQAEFIQKFGFTGDFELIYQPTRFRSAYRIRSASARTTRALSKEPGWLGKFIRQKL